MGHWFVLILVLLAILNQLLSCESSLQTQLSLFPCEDNVVVVAKYIMVEVEIVSTKGILQVDCVF